MLPLGIQPACPRTAFQKLLPRGRHCHWLATQDAGCWSRPSELRRERSGRGGGEADDAGVQGEGTRDLSRLVLDNAGWRYASSFKLQQEIKREYLYKY